MEFLDINGKIHIFELHTKYSLKDEETSRSKKQWELGRLLSKVYGPNNILEDYPLPGCGNLSWDFWIPKRHLAFEYHGEQHDKFIKYFHTSNINFQKQKIKDSKKQQIADMNNISLIVIREEDFTNWTVEELLDIINRRT